MPGTVTLHIVIKMLFLYRVACEANAQSLENLLVDIREHHRRVHLASFEFGKLRKCLATILVVVAQQRESHKHLICVQAGIASMKILYLSLLNGLDECFGNKLHSVRNTRQIFGCIKNERGARAQQ